MEEQQRIRTLLRHAGFVRVDGLQTHNHFFPGSSKSLIKPNPDKSYRWDVKEGRIVVITPKGEIWLSVNVDAVAKDDLGHTLVLSKAELVQGAQVPLPIWCEFDMDDILHRLVDPDWTS